MYSSAPRSPALLFVIGKTLIGLYLQHSDLGSGWGDARRVDDRRAGVDVLLV